MSETFTVTPDSQGVLDIEDRAAIHAAIRAHAGYPIDVIVKRHRSKRSIKQNDRYWALMTVAAESLWEDRTLKDDVHEALAGLYFALPPCPKTGIKRRKRTPDTETDEFGRYMDWCERKLVEYGADLSAWDSETRKAAA